MPLTSGTIEPTYETVEALQLTAVRDAIAEFDGTAPTGETLTDLVAGVAAQYAHLPLLRRAGCCRTYKDAYRATIAQLNAASAGVTHISAYSPAGYMRPAARHAIAEFIPLVAA